MSRPPPSASVPLPPSGTRGAGCTSYLCLVTAGVRQDVLPLLGLGYGLRASGFSLRIVTNACHERLVRRHGFAFSPLQGDLQALMRSAAFQEAAFADAPARVAALAGEASRAVLAANMGLIHAACRGADGILCGVGVLSECSAIGQKYQIPVLLAPLLPYAPSSDVPVAQFLASPAPPDWLARLTVELSGLLSWSSVGRMLNRFRTEALAIGPQRGFVLEGVPQVVGCSEIVVPRPAEWAASVHAAAAWSLPRAVAAAGLRRLQPALHRLLEPPVVAAAAGGGGGGAHAPLARPIYVGFDAVAMPDAVGLIRRLHALATRLGIPVLFVAGASDVTAARSSPLLENLEGVVWELGLRGAAPDDEYGDDVFAAEAAAEAAAAMGAPAAAGVESAAAAAAAAREESAAALLVSPPPPPPPPPRVVLLVVKEAPYEWALPRCSLAVHSGSAGVTLAAFEAGTPSLAFPAFGEQLFWAARIGALLGGGDAPPPTHISRLFERLDERVDEARRPIVTARAAALGAALRERGEGPALATAIIRDLLSRPQHRHCGIVCAWAADESADACSRCRAPFTLTNRRRHCRSCGRIACHACLETRCHLPGYPECAPQIVCEPCRDARRGFIASQLGRPALPAPLPAAAAGGGGGEDDSGGGGGDAGSVSGGGGEGAGGGGAAVSASVASPRLVPLSRSASATRRADRSDKVDRSGIASLLASTPSSPAAPSSLARSSAIRIAGAGAGGGALAAAAAEAARANSSPSLGALPSSGSAAAAAIGAGSYLGGGSLLDAPLLLGGRAASLQGAGLHRGSIGSGAGGGGVRGSTPKGSRAAAAAAAAGRESGGGSRASPAPLE